MDNQNKRKVSSLFINPDFQGKFVAIFTIFGLFQAFVNYYAIYFSFGQIRDAAISSESGSAEQLAEMIQMQEFYVVTFLGITFAISFLIFVLVGVRYTHQAAGALHRMKLEFASMKEGKILHPITLRKGDFFRDVEGAFNEMVDAVSPGSKNPKEQ